MPHLRAWAKAEIEAMTPIQIKIVMGEMRDEYQAIDYIVGVANPTDTLYLEASNSMQLPPLELPPPLQLPPLPPPPPQPCRKHSRACAQLATCVI
jgi:hypothetical protein